VNSITKVEERTASQAEWDELEASNYELLEGGRIERIGCYWPDRVRVTYSGGYPEGGAPADILEALLLQCEFNVRRIGGDKVGIRSQGSGVPGGGFTSFDEAYLHPTFAKLARQYRRVV
jgi:hypothetical protein